ncbi:MAG: YjfB family protein [Vallitalea sp.]|jgi:hypothetical protein|nr:YjfB family protein [Vallitalea sp.]
MDIAALSTALAQGKIAQQASISVAKMTMNLSKQQGQAMSELLQTTKVMEQSVTPHIGSNIDIKL